MLVLYQALLAKVSFDPTDDPYFYDVADRIGPKRCLEKEMLYESEAAQGITSLPYKDWLRSYLAGELLRPSVRIGADTPFAVIAEGAARGDDAERTVLSYEDWLPLGTASGGVDFALPPPMEEIHNAGS